MNSFVDSFPQESHGVTQNNNQGCSAAQPSPSGSHVVDDLVSREGSSISSTCLGRCGYWRTCEPHAKWSTFTGQHPQGQEGRNPSDVSHSEALEVLGASDNPTPTFLGHGIPFPS